MKVSRHAADRYIERVKPAFDHTQAKSELARLIDMSPVIEELPWSETEIEGEATLVAISDEICAVIRNETVITILVKVDHPDKLASRRQRRHRRRPDRKGRQTERPRRQSRNFDWSEYSAAH